MVPFCRLFNLYLFSPAIHYGVQVSSFSAAEKTSPGAISVMHSCRLGQTFLWQGEHGSSFLMTIVWSCLLSV
jgi:hypothetical protein